MKSYNVSNYIKYKQDLSRSMPDDEILYAMLTRDELIIKFLPLVENLARKFSTSQQASGVLSINDLIQEGSVGLVAAVDRIDWEKLCESDDIEKTIKSFLSKRIKGAIRRAIDINRGNIRIPEHKLNEIRKDFGKNRAMQIAEKLQIKGTSAYVRVSQLKKQAVERLIENVDHSQVLDYL